MLQKRFLFVSASLSLRVQTPSVPFAWVAAKGAGSVWFLVLVRDKGVVNSAWLTADEGLSLAGLLLALVSVVWRESRL